MRECRVVRSDKMHAIVVFSLMLLPTDYSTMCVRLPLSVCNNGTNVTMRRCVNMSMYAIISVPKKVMFNAATLYELIRHDAPHFEIGGVDSSRLTFDWKGMKDARDTYIGRLNKIYANGLVSAGVDHVQGYATFASPNTIKVGSETITAKHIVIAVGGKARPLGVKGQEYVIDSDGFFALDTQPKKVGVIGAGYIAVELAGVFNGLGTDTSLFVRQGCALREFDSMISKSLDDAMKKSGISVVTNAAVREVKKEVDGTLTLHLQNGEVKLVMAFRCAVASPSCRVIFSFFFPCPSIFVVTGPWRIRYFVGCYWSATTSGGAQSRSGRRSSR
jgi:Pyridine nucleotide-disulphide oxidoreductase